LGAGSLDAMEATLLCGVGEEQRWLPSVPHRIG
jgi:hypothetical protein